ARALQAGLVGRRLELAERERAGLEVGERLALFAEGPRAIDPQIARVAVPEVDLRLFEQRRHGSNHAEELLLIRARQRVAEPPQIDDRFGGGTLVLRYVALLGPDARVERRVARPRLQHAQVEVHSVQLGPEQPVVDALSVGPALRIDGVEAALVAPELL